MAAPPLITIRPGSAGEIVDLRHRVLRQGLPRHEAIFPGDAIETTLHVVAEQNGAIVGCSTIVQSTWHDVPAWQLRGMAVDEFLRGSGVGRQMLAKVDEIVAVHPFGDRLWCNARQVAISFYERLGWTARSDWFDIPTAGPHKRMTKNIEA